MIHILNVFGRLNVLNSIECWKKYVRQYRSSIRTGVNISKEEAKQNIEYKCNVLEHYRGKQQHFHYRQDTEQTVQSEKMRSLSSFSTLPLQHQCYLLPVDSCWCSLACWESRGLQAANLAHFLYLEFILTFVNKLAMIAVTMFNFERRCQVITECKSRKNLDKFPKESYWHRIVLTGVCCLCEFWTVMTWFNQWLVWSF